MKLNTLGRAEKLKSGKAIDALFESGLSISVHPIRLVYQLIPSSDNTHIKIGFAVPRKSFKRAVDRNLLKRRMREAYRLNKNQLFKNGGGLITGLEMMMIFQGRETEEYDKISKSVIEVLRKLNRKVVHYLQ